MVAFPYLLGMSLDSFYHLNVLVGSCHYPVSVQLCPTNTTLCSQPGKQNNSNSRPVIKITATDNSVSNYYDFLQEEMRR